MHDLRKRGWEVEGIGFENRQGRNLLEGSNPSASADVSETNEAEARKRTASLSWGVWKTEQCEPASMWVGVDELFRRKVSVTKSPLPPMWVNELGEGFEKAASYFEVWKIATACTELVQFKSLRFRNELRITPLSRSSLDYADDRHWVLFLFQYSTQRVAVALSTLLVARAGVLSACRWHHWLYSI